MEEKSKAKQNIQPPHVVTPGYIMQHVQALALLHLYNLFCFKITLRDAKDKYF